MEQTDDVQGTDPKRQVFFRARQPVRWLAPNLMVRGAYRALVGGLFSRYADNRDRIDLIRPAVFHSGPGIDLALFSDPLGLDPEPDEPLIIDYVADVGDGFGATWAVAELLAEPELVVGDRVLPRGDVLVFGGDQVYPVANPTDYRDRTVGPYALAFSRDRGPEPDRPTFAVPGNHDWYDGLASFLDLFTVVEPTDPPVDDGPWGRRQTRSYFAAELREGWWLWGIDVGLNGTGRISQGQVAYFREAAGLLRDDDRVILCLAEPAWLKRGPVGLEREPDPWDHLVDFLQGALGGHHWTDVVALMISGDKHYYARHEADEGEPPSEHPEPREQQPEQRPERPERPVLVTAGGGGAYLSSTLDAHDRVELNMQPVQQRSGLETFACEERWPTKRTSMWMGINGLFRIPLTNPMLNSVFSLLYGLFAYFSLTGWRRPDFATSRTFDRTLDELATAGWLEAMRVAGVGALVTLSGLVFVLLLAGAVVAYTVAAGKDRRRRWVVVVTVVHVVLHGLGLVLALVVAARLAWVPGAHPEEVRWWYVLGLWVAALVVMATPIAWNRFWYRVGEWQRLALLFLPSVLALAVLGVLTVPNSQTGALTMVVAVSLLGGVFGPVAFTTSLVLGQVWLIGLNELFVGIRRTGYKHILRIELYAEGPVVNVIGIERTIPRTVHLDSDRRIHVTGMRRADRWTGRLTRSLRPTEPELIDRFGSPEALAAAAATARRRPVI